MTVPETYQTARIHTALMALDDLPPAEATAIAAFTLDTLGAGFPRLPGFGDLREEAALWADAASHWELEAYTVEGLRRLGRVPLALESRRRLLGQLWRTLPDSDRSAFLNKIRRAA